MYDVLSAHTLTLAPVCLRQLARPTPSHTAATPAPATLSLPPRIYLATQRANGRAHTLAHRSIFNAAQAQG